MSTYLPILSDVNKEVFYTEMKRLICLIKTDSTNCNNQINTTKLHQLKSILSLKVLGYYPKLSLLLYDLLIEYMPVFENEWLCVKTWDLMYPYTMSLSSYLSTYT